MNGPSAIRQDSRDDGVTLVEVLVALVLVSLIGVLLTGALGQFGKLRELRQDIETRTRLHTAEEIIRRDLRGMVSAPMLTVEVGRAGYYFLGNKTSMTFVANVPIGFAATGVREVSYFLRGTDDEAELVRRSLPYGQTNTDQLERVEDIVILKPVSGFQLEFFDSEGRGYAEWTVKGVVPADIRWILE